MLPTMGNATKSSCIGHSGSPLD